MLGVAGEHVGRVLAGPVQHQLLPLADHLAAEVGGQGVHRFGDHPRLVGIDRTGPERRHGGIEAVIKLRGQGGELAGAGRAGGQGAGQPPGGRGRPDRLCQVPPGRFGHGLGLPGLQPADLHVQVPHQPGQLGIAE